MISRLEAVNAVSAKNELLPGLNTSVIRLNLTNLGIVDPLSGKRIEQTFAAHNHREERETQVNLAMLNELQKNSGTGVWLSPPDSFYNRGKILVAIREGNQIVEYDITGQTFSGRDFASFITSLAGFSREGYYFLPDPKILEEVIPMSVIWESIRNDQAEIKFNQEVEEIQHQNDPKAYFLKKEGVDIDKACPKAVEVTQKRIGPDGKIQVFARACGICGKEINDWITKGYRCKHCGEIYLGVC
ncbi:hypothetical protein M1403_02455 [Patescibacteria group bacterium]|nr:hypothetical protein [Patescibacteria group bacterium]